MPYDYIHATCPNCKKPHVDEGIWAEKPHRTHRCVDDAAGKGCGREWEIGWPTISVLPAAVAPCRMFAEEKEGVFWHQNPNRWWVGLCVAKDANIVEVDVREDPGGRYHGWVYAGSSVPCFIWPSEVQRDICFDSVTASERVGKGRRVRLSCTRAAPSFLG